MARARRLSLRLYSAMVSDRWLPVIWMTWSVLEWPPVVERMGGNAWRAFFRDEFWIVEFWIVSDAAAVLILVLVLVLLVIIRALFPSKDSLECKR